MRWFVLILFLCSCASPKPSLTASEQLKKTGFPRTDHFMQELLGQYPQYFDSLLQRQDTWRISIVYTRIDRTRKGAPRFTNFYYNVDPAAYFYPASTVKMPVAFLALQKLNELAIPGLNKETTMITEADFPGLTAVYNDPQSSDGRPTIANYIRKIFLVSDNDAYNRLYEFLGQEYIHKKLQAMGYDSTQILHRLEVSLPEAANRHSNQIHFYDTSGQLVYQLPGRDSKMNYQPRNTKMGTGYMKAGKKVPEPFDFSAKNRITLPDLHSMLQSVIFPQAVSARERFILTDEDYAFLYRYMSMKPVESDYPSYDSTYTDAYVKFLMYGGKGKMDKPGLRIYNKVGDAYGFLTDVAYITDTVNHVEFFLSATIYCNTDGIFNDDHYDYEQVGLPFMKNLGNIFYTYELGRKKKILRR